MGLNVNFEVFFMVIGGTSGPVTLPGMLTLINAEVLAGIVLARFYTSPSHGHLKGNDEFFKKPLFSDQFFWKGAFL